MGDFSAKTANDFTNCIKGYIENEESENNTEERFWELIKSIRFENAVISPECELFRCMKNYADEHPIDKISLIWALHFEQTPNDKLKSALLSIIAEKNRTESAG